MGRPVVVVPRIADDQSADESKDDATFFEEEVDEWRTLAGEAPAKHGVIVQALVQRIETVIEEYREELATGACVLEVEGRLGSLMSHSGDERVRLPVETEALLSPVDSDELHYRFEAGLSLHKYQVLADYIKRLLGITAERSSKGHVKKRSRICQMELMATNDHFCEVEGPDNERRAVRVSFVPGESEPLEAIYKKRLVRMDVYTGSEQHTEDEALRSAVVDFRLAVNLEYKEQTPEGIRSRPDRCRKRQSFPLFGLYRVDMTEVLQEHQQVYEVEMEINPDALRHEYSRRSKGRANRLYPVVSDFVANLRGMAAFLNNKNDESQTALNCSDLRDCGQPTERLDRYLHKVSPIVPIIGDYLFRAVSADLTELSRPDVSAADIEKSKQTRLTEAEMLELAARHQATD